MVVLVIDEVGCCVGIILIVCVVLQIDAHQDDADAVALDDRSPQIIYSGGDDGLCKVWDRRCFSETNPIPVGTLAGHKDGITFIDTKVPCQKSLDLMCFCSPYCCLSQNHTLPVSLKIYAHRLIHCH